MKRVREFLCSLHLFLEIGRRDGVTASFEKDPIKRLRKSNFIEYLRIKPHLANNGKIVLKLKVDDHVLNLNDTLHGGVHATLLDTVIGQAIAQQAESPVATINLSVYYSAPARIGSLLTAEAAIVNKGNSIATGEGTIKDENGTLIAKAVGSFKILQPKPSR